MRLTLTEPEYDAEYWARQIRLGTWIAVGVTFMIMLRVLIDWQAADRWWSITVGAVAVVQAVPLFLPWRTLVHRPRARLALQMWWTFNVPLLWAFALVDDATLLFYVPGSILISMLAASLFAPGGVLLVGMVSVLGYLALLPEAAGAGNSTLLVGLGELLVVVTGLCAGTAGNRGELDAQRRSVERRTEALLESASDAVLAVDLSGDICYASPSTRSVFGHDPRWMLGAPLAEMVHPEDLPGFTEWLDHVLAAPFGARARTEPRIRRADGTWLYADVLGTSRANDPDLRAAVLSVRDVGERRALEEQLTRQAFSDSLTGLANRALFRDRIDHALARNRRGAGRITLLLIDIDRFKDVNDGLGHTSGDQLLRVLAGRLRAEVRGCDTLARIGGDEFAALVEDLDDIGVAALADRVVAAVRRPVPLGDRTVACTVSIGVATVKADDDDLQVDELLRNADLAMYAAKQAGGDGHAVYDPAMHNEVLYVAEQRAEMEHALAGEQFVVHYQPIVDLPRRKLTGFEALVRWNHPRKGLVGPNAFITVAESTGLIVPLGRWVLREACAQLARWEQTWPSAPRLRMSVNLSARQFHYDGLVDDVAAALADSGVHPGDLVLEITESMLMTDTEATIVTLRALKQLGVRLAIDDFGTGYSSLSYLRQFPVDILKIDRSFVDGVSTDSEDATLAEAVVHIGQALSLQTVAEGIETDDQWATLRMLGCEYGQGYLFSRPAEPERIEELLGRAGEPLASDVRES